MRRVSTKAWVASSLALGLTALLGVVALHLWRLPPLPTQIGGPGCAPRRWISGGPNDVLAVENKRAFRIDAALHVTQLTWPEGLVLEELESAALADGKLALTGKAHDHDPDKTFPVVLLADEAQLALIYKPKNDVKRAHVSNVLVTTPEEDEPKETRFAFYVQEDNSIYRTPFWSAGRDADDDRHPVEAWLRAHAVEKIVWRPGEGPLFLCATERRHLDEKQAPVMPTIAIDVYGNDHETPEVKPLPALLAGADPISARPPSLVSGQVLLQVTYCNDDSRRYDAVPLGKSWLWLGVKDAFVTDAGGQRLDHVSRATSLRVLTDDPSLAWFLILALIALGALSLPLLIWRAFRAAEVANTRALFGTLRIPEGGALETDKRGHVEIRPGTSVRVASIGGHDVELGPGLRRADPRVEVPLIDGDDVFVLGQVQGDDAGPWRSSGRKRLVADGGRHHIGRGTAADFAEQMTARANATIVMVAVPMVVAALLLLLRFGMVS
jgi:hypothetical protein